MARDISSIQNEISEAVAETNVQVVSESPAVALGSLNQSMAFTMGLALQNATLQQQSSNVITQATTAKCVEILIEK